MLIEGLTVGPLEENCWIVGAAPRCAIVDPGAESDRIFAAVERHDLVPEQILLTHGHVDHIAHCAHVAERYDIGVWVHPADAPLLAGAFVCLNTSLALWSVAGLETSLFAFLLVAAVLRYEGELGAGRARPWSAALYGLAWLTRPEAPAYLAYFALRRRPRAAWWGLLAGLVVPYELFGLVCECGYGFMLSTVSELAPGDAKVVSIQFRQGRALRRLAA